jgi:hypothetical protein
MEHDVLSLHAVETLPECTWYAPLEPERTLPLAASPPGSGGRPLCSHRMRLFQCPADVSLDDGLSGNQTLTRTDRVPYCFPWAGSSYAANYQAFGTVNKLATPGAGNFCGPKYNIDKLPDGLSNTVFFGEQFAACGTSAGNLWAYPGIGNYSGSAYTAVPGAQAPAGADDSIVNTPLATNSKLWFPAFANSDPVYGFTTGGRSGSIFEHNGRTTGRPLAEPYDVAAYWDAPPQGDVHPNECDKARLQCLHRWAVQVGMGDGSVRGVFCKVSQHSWYCAIRPDDGLAFDESW